MDILANAISLQTKSKGGDNTCPPSDFSLTFFDALPESIKPFFNTPRGVCDSEGEYIGSIIQIAKGSLGRLHGPALEYVGREILTLLESFDERGEEARAENPLIIVVNGEELIWDVRRYSSSQDQRGRWQSIPDYSLYFDTTQRQMREALNTDENDEQEKEEKPTRNRRRRKA